LARFRKCCGLKGCELSMDPKDIRSIEYTSSSENHKPGRLKSAEE
jgi:hypothetical protein